MVIKDCKGNFTEHAWRRPTSADILNSQKGQPRMQTQTHSPPYAYSLFVNTGQTTKHTRAHHNRTAARKQDPQQHTAELGVNGRAEELCNMRRRISARTQPVRRSTHTTRAPERAAAERRQHHAVVASARHKYTRCEHHAAISDNMDNARTSRVRCAECPGSCAACCAPHHR